ncbi:MAG: ECF transporter S component [Oscillospiraceae bacterium]
MNKTQNRAVQSQQIHDLVILSIFIAIIFLLAFTPIGLIDLPLIKATILHVPVIIGAILLGPKKGAFLGFIFGLTSLLKNTMVPSALSFAFSPFIPVPGLDHGSLWALVICFVPRILVGITPWAIYRLANLFSQRGKTPLQAAGMAAAGAVGAFTNTILVMGLIFLVFQNAYAAMRGIPVDAVLGVILGIVGANGIPEAVVAAVLTPTVCLPLMHVLKCSPATSSRKVHVTADSAL